MRRPRGTLTGRTATATLQWGHAVNVSRGMASWAHIGTDAHRLLCELFPIPRSLTGDGVRETFRLLNQWLPLQVHEVPSGTEVFDWTVPDEWNFREAWIKGPDGRLVLDARQNNLHVLGYSEPVHVRMPLVALREHLHSLPELPDAVPYLTTYYARRWGFCLSQNQLEELQEGDYEVFIDADLAPGHLTWAEAVLPGQTEKEFLLSTYICHPSLANDNLSGVVTVASLYRLLEQRPRRFTYRFLFVPETIGAVAYLAEHGQRLKEKLAGGLVVTCVGDAGAFTYKKSRRGDSMIDRVCAHVLKSVGAQHSVRDFWPTGSDERQYCSPGFDLPMGSLMRSVYGEFPEYHTSLDDTSFVTAENLAESIRVYDAVLRAFDDNLVYVSRAPFGEPQLGKRGLYPTLGSQRNVRQQIEATMWLLNLADGKHSLVDMAERSGLSIFTLQEIGKRLAEAGLIESREQA